MRGEVLVVVVTHDGLDSLKRCLAALRRHTRDVRHRLVVIDNGSRDGTAEFLAGFAARSGCSVVRHERNLGKAAALNALIREASPEWWAFLDDDAVVSPRWLSRLLAAARSARPRPVAVGCRSLFPDGRIYSAEMFLWIDGHGKKERDLGQRDYTRFCDAVAGTCFLVRHEAFREALFDERLRQQFEDADFCLKLRKRGLRVLYCGAVAVRHENLSRASPAAVDRNRRAMARRWGWPSFRDSHPLDRLYARAWGCWRDRDWAGLARAGLRLQETDPVPTYPGWWAALGLSRLGRHAQAAAALDRSLAIPCLPDHLKARMELARERARRFGGA